MSLSSIRQGGARPAFTPPPPSLPIAIPQRSRNQSAPLPLQYHHDHHGDHLHLERRGSSARVAPVFHNPVKSYIEGDGTQSSEQIQAYVREHYGELSPKKRDKLVKAAIDNQDGGLIQVMRAAGYNFNARNQAIDEASSLEGLGLVDTNLTYAIGEEKPRAIRALIQAGADVNQPNGFEVPPVRAAMNVATSGTQNLRPLKALLEGFPDLRALREEQIAQLHELAETDDDLKDLVNAQLLHAAKTGDQERIQFLVETVGLHPKTKVGRWDAGTVAGANSRLKTAEVLKRMGGINLFPYRVVQFAHDMLAAKTDEDKKKTALFDFLTAKAEPSIPKKDTAPSTSQDEEQFPFEE